MAEMTREFLKKLCKENGLYSTPSINDKLYLHYKGFNSISNLEEYTGLKALWLEGNGLIYISGLENQRLIKSLYLHENCIEKIEGLNTLTLLDTLNLSKNYIKKIENLSHMTSLSSLNLGHNLLSTCESVVHILEVPSIQTIDIQHNKIEDANVLDIFAAMPDLRVLYLMGNPVVKNIRNYRRTVVSRCKSLKYLDDRPVFDEERRRTNAWAKVIEQGGTNDEALEAEREELKLIRKEKDELDERNFRAFEQLMREGQEIRRLRELEQAQSLTGTVEVNPFSGEEIIRVPESEELKRVREARWGITESHVNTALPPPPPVEVKPPSPPEAAILIDSKRDQLNEEDAFSLLPPPPPAQQKEDDEEEGGPIPESDAADTEVFDLD
eukprot:gene24629-33098_t